VRLFSLEHPALPQPQRGCPSITLKPNLRPIGISVKPSACTAIVLRVEPADDIDAQPPSWLKTICLEAMRRSLGKTPWFALRGERTPEPHEHTPSPHALDLLFFDGRAEDWAAVLDACIERERVDDVARMLVSVISATRKREPLCWLPAWRPPRARRVPLGYVQRWLSIAIGDDARAATVIEAAKSAPPDDVRRLFGNALDHECFWIERHHERIVAAGHLKEPAQLRALAVLSMVIDAVATNHDMYLAAAERAMKALGEYGAPVLSPEHSLGLHFDERPGASFPDDIHDSEVSESMFISAGNLCLHIAHLLEAHKAPGLYVAGARVIGTVAEWRGLAAALVR
jgi:hypothetical protein